MAVMHNPGSQQIKDDLLASGLTQIQQCDLMDSPRTANMIQTQSTESSCNKGGAEAGTASENFQEQHLAGRSQSPVEGNLRSSLGQGWWRSSRSRLRRQQEAKVTQEAKCRTWKQICISNGEGNEDHTTGAVPRHGAMQLRLSTKANRPVGNREQTPRDLDAFMQDHVMSIWIFDPNLTTAEAGQSRHQIVAGRLILRIAMRGCAERVDNEQRGEAETGRHLPHIAGQDLRNSWKSKGGAMQPAHGTETERPNLETGGRKGGTLVAALGGWN